MLDKSFPNDFAEKQIKSEDEYLDSLTRSVSGLCLSTKKIFVVVFF